MIVVFERQNLAIPTPIPTLKGAARLILRQSGMSALPPKADINRKGSNVRFVPIADIPLLFNRLIHAGKQRRRHCEAEGLGGLEVDNQLEPNRP